MPLKWTYHLYEAKIPYEYFIGDFYVIKNPKIYLIFHQFIKIKQRVMFDNLQERNVILEYLSQSLFKMGKDRPEMAFIHGANKLVFMHYYR